MAVTHFFKFYLVMRSAICNFNSAKFSQISIKSGSLFSIHNEETHMSVKTAHYISGLTLSIFIGLHLMNHVYGIFGADRHIELMNVLRHFYRTTFVETIILASVFTQIISGLRLFSERRKKVRSAFEKLQIWTGLYLALFLVIHLTAVFSGRFFLHLDTNFYFGVAGLNTFPLNLFFIPYYGLAILSVFGHIASIHARKMNKTIFGLTPHKQSILILTGGILVTVLIFYGLTNHFNGVDIPTAYNVLIGR